MRAQPKSWIVPILLLLFSLWAMRALFHSGFYTSHDGWHLVARLYHWHKAIADGQIPPRWNSELLNGFGYPLFIFSYQLPWWLAELFVLAGTDIFTAIKAVFILTYAASGLFMFLWLRNQFEELSAFVGAFVYLFTPYRFVNIFVRANLGEAVSFMFFPLIFWGLSQLRTKNYRLGIILGTIGFSGSLLSHVMVAPLFGLTMLLFLVLNRKGSALPKRYFWYAGLILIAALGLAAYYLLPAYIYRPLTVFSDIYKHLYTNHLTPLSKLLYSPWGYVAVGLPEEMSRQVGVVHWLVFGVSFLVIFWRIIKRQTFTFENRWLVVFLIGFTAAIFMMLPNSLFVWKAIENWMLIDFPWRFLAVTTFCGSVMAGALAHLAKKFWTKWLWIVLVVLVSLYTNRNHLRVNQYTDVPLDLYIASELTTNTDDEYLPKWVNRDQVRTQKPLIDVVEPTNVHRQTNRISFEYSLNRIAPVSIYQMYFPGWKASVDGQALSIDKSQIGGIKMNVPQGHHMFELRYIPTAPMRLGELISILTVFILIIQFRKLIKQK